MAATSTSEMWKEYVLDTPVFDDISVTYFDKVVVSGAFLDEGEKGVFILADSLIESDQPIPERRKRGGL